MGGARSATDLSCLFKKSTSKYISISLVTIQTSSSMTLLLTLLELWVARLVINNAILRAIDPLLGVTFGRLLQVLDVTFQVCVGVVVLHQIKKNEI